MHHGYYGADGSQPKERRQAQIDLIEELLHWADIQTAEKTLDVGCGIGGSSLYLAEKLTAQVTGITLSPIQAQRAIARAKEAGMDEGEKIGGWHDEIIASPTPNPQPLIPTPIFQVADALNMPFADRRFDLVWSLESGEHMPDKLKFLQECYRVLQPGGTLMLATWCHRSTEASPLTASERRHLEKIYQVYCLPYVLSLSQYAAIARSVGFQQIRTADWSTAVAPFWNDVISSAFSPSAVLGLLRSGWSTIQAALSLGLMRQGYDRGLICFGLLCATRPVEEQAP